PSIPPALTARSITPARGAGSIPSWISRSRRKHLTDEWRGGRLADRSSILLPTFPTPTNHPSDSLPPPCAAYRNFPARSRLFDNLQTLWRHVGSEAGEGSSNENTLRDRVCARRRPSTKTARRN